MDLLTNGLSELCESMVSLFLLILQYTRLECITESIINFKNVKIIVKGNTVFKRTSNELRRRGNISTCSLNSIVLHEFSFLRMNLFSKV